MTPPPLPAWVIAAGLAHNYARSLQGRTTISRWACRNKRVAVPVAVVGSCWLVWHWSLYVLDVDVPTVL